MHTEKYRDCKMRGNTAVIDKVGNGENMNTYILLQIRNILGVNITNIIESIPESEAKSSK